MHLSYYSNFSCSLKMLYFIPLPSPRYISAPFSIFLLSISTFGLVFVHVQLGIRNRPGPVNLFSVENEPFKPVN